MWQLGPAGAIARVGWRLVARLLSSCPGAAAARMRIVSLGTTERVWLAGFPLPPTYRPQFLSPPTLSANLRARKHGIGRFPKYWPFLARHNGVLTLCTNTTPQVLELTGYVDWWAKKKANKERTARDAAEQLAVTSPGGGAAPSRQQARRALDAQVGRLGWGALVRSG